MHVTIFIYRCRIGTNATQKNTQCDTKVEIASAAIFYLKIGPLSWSFPIKVVFLHTTNLS